jgi:hypothetical protein
MGGIKKTKDNESSVDPTKLTPEDLERLIEERAKEYAFKILSESNHEETQKLSGEKNKLLEKIETEYKDFKDKTDGPTEVQLEDSTKNPKKITDVYGQDS